MARGKGKMPARAWIYDQLVERKFQFFDEFISLYKAGDDNTKAKLLMSFAEYLFPKARPEDATGDAGEANAPMLIVTDEQLERLVQSARGEPLPITPDDIKPLGVSEK
jgi:hypothetical protein